MEYFAFKRYENDRLKRSFFFKFVFFYYHKKYRFFSDTADAEVGI